MTIMDRIVGLGWVGLDSPPQGLRALSTNVSEVSERQQKPKSPICTIDDRES